MNTIGKCSMGCPNTTSGGLRVLNETAESMDSKLEFVLSASSHMEKLKRTMQVEVTVRGSLLIKKSIDKEFHSRKMKFGAQSFHF